MWLHTKKKEIIYLNLRSDPAAYSNCLFPTDIQETSVANPYLPISSQLNFPLTL